LFFIMAEVAIYKFKRWFWIIFDNGRDDKFRYKIRGYFVCFFS
jgi:hypothetical protein